MSVVFIFTRFECSFQCTPKVNLSQADIESLDKRIQDAGTEVVNAKGGAGSATLSMAYAANKFLDAVLKGLLGEKSTACAYVGGQGPECEYLAGPVEFDKTGAAKLLPIPATVTEYEKKRIAEAKSKLVGDIKAGIDFIVNPPAAATGDFTRFECSFRFTRFRCSLLLYSFRV